MNKQNIFFSTIVLLFGLSVFGAGTETEANSICIVKNRLKGTSSPRTDLTTVVPDGLYNTQEMSFENFTVEFSSGMRTLSLKQGGVDIASTRVSSLNSGELVTLSTFAFGVPAVEVSCNLVLKLESQD